VTAQRAVDISVLVNKLPCQQIILLVNWFSASLPKKSNFNPHGQFL